MTEISDLIHSYQKWLRDKTIVKEGRNFAEITTPHIDRHNDYIQIYVKKNGDRFIISDDGYTLSDLLQSGCSLDAPRRQAILKTILNGFGVAENSGSIEIHATRDNFALKKHNLVQAIISVNDMFFLAKPYVSSLFLEDVTGWLDFNDIRYMPNIKFSGKSSYDHRFDFAIPKSKTHPERIIKVINNPTRDSAEALAFAWIDTRDVRPDDSMAFAFVNDNEKSVSSSVTDALENYAVTPILWSKRDSFVSELAS